MPQSPIELQEQTTEINSENETENNIDNLKRLTDTAGDAKVEQIINASFIRMQKEKKKLPEGVKNTIKKTYNGHWNDEKKAFSVPIENKIPVRTFLANEGIEAVFEDGHDRFFDLDQADQKKERMTEAKDFKIKKTIKEFIIPFQETLNHYNKFYDANLKINNFENKSLDDLSVGIEDVDRLKYLKLLSDNYQNLEKAKDVIKVIDDKIKSPSPNKKKRIDLEKPTQNGLQIIQIIPGQIHVTTNQAEEILNSTNLGIFQRSGQLVRIITEVSKPKKNKLLDKNGIEIIKRSAEALLIAEVDPIYLTELLGRHANWTKFDERKGDWVRKDCPERIAKHLIARREWNLPVLTGIIQAPTLRHDGSILDKPGYDENTGLFFDAGNAEFFPIPAFPSKEEAIDALNILLGLIKDFTFENDESKSVALSAILTGLVRKSIRTAPLHGFTAPKMGSGKSLLADVVGLIATGKSNSVIPQAENEAEEAKRLLSILAEGDSIICYDNIERPFGSPALCSVLTQEEFKNRLLGQNRNLSVRTNSTFLATGNNLTFVGDTSTRAILCRLDPECERPEERIFDIDLRQYIPLHRGELVKAGLIILRAYHIAGRPKQDIPQYGRFEGWSDWIRSSLIWLGLKDPCDSRKEIENSDPTRVSLSNLLTAWHEYLGDISYTLKSAISKAEKEKAGQLNEKAESFLDSIKEISSGKDEINTRSLGKKLANFKGRIENGYRIEKSAPYQGVDTWRVKKVIGLKR